MRSPQSKPLPMRWICLNGSRLSRCALFSDMRWTASARRWPRAATRIFAFPCWAAKHSLNVATAGGVVLFELLRKYRALARQAGA